MRPGLLLVDSYSLALPLQGFHWKPSGSQRSLPLCKPWLFPVFDSWKPCFSALQLPLFAQLLSLATAALELQSARGKAASTVRFNYSGFSSLHKFDFCKSCYLGSSPMFTNRWYFTFCPGFLALNRRIAQKQASFIVGNRSLYWVCIYWWTIFPTGI